MVSDILPAKRFISLTGWFWPFPPLFERCFPSPFFPHRCLDFSHKTALVCSLLSIKFLIIFEYFPQLHLPKCFSGHQNCNVHRRFLSLYIRIACIQFPIGIICCLLSCICQNFSCTLFTCFCDFYPQISSKL